MSLLARLKNWFECPPRLLAVRAAVANDSVAILDVGCGNHSASITRRFFPDCIYHAVDCQPWNVDERDAACTDRLFEADLNQTTEFPAIEEGRYDAVLFSHVLEHLDDPYPVALALAAKVRPGGLVYIEVPSSRSLRLPRTCGGRWGVKGCLNFYDDPTHRTMVDLDRLAERLRGAGFDVGPAFVRRLWRRIGLLPLYAAAGLVLRGYIPSSVFWDVTGFAVCLTARRRSAGFYQGKPSAPQNKIPQAAGL